MKHATNRCSLFISNFVQDAFFYIFILLLLSLLRILFLVVFKNEILPNTPFEDILLTLWYGLRISLKTAGALFLPAFVFGTLAQTIYPRWDGKKARFIWACIAITGLILLFQSRIPYYQEFHNAFDPFVFNTLHDDVKAITTTAIMQYGAVWRVLAGLLFAGIGIWLFSRWQKLSAYPIRLLLAFKNHAMVVVCICLFLAPTAVFVRRGGSFNYNGSIYWKNAARMSQHLLNEAILDDIQALYKASRIFKQFAKYSQDLSPQMVQEAAARLQGTASYTEMYLLPFLQRTAPGNAIEKPQHIFVIVAETYMLWPLLDKYKNLPIAEGMRRIIAQPDSIFLPHFLPASNGTMFGLTSILLGLPEVNLLTANRPTALKPHETALSVQLKELGYKTRFFYGGFSSWENVGTFMNNQQMDESFYYADFGAQGGVWGVKDKEFLQGTVEKITDEPSFNLILTSTNHPPLVVDMTQEPTLPTAEELEKLLPETVTDKKLLIERLQHFAYADKYLAEFIETMRQKYPNSLFIITGDHADRWTFLPNPSAYERLAVPLVITGKGITKDMLPAAAAGSHMDIAPTVLELILPKGAPYYALGKNVLQQPNTALHAYYWANDKYIGELGSDKYEALPGGTKDLTSEQAAAIRQQLRDTQTIAAWRILEGTSLEK